MSEVKQTNISLEESQYQRVKDLAEREGKSISQIIRELIDESFHLEGEDRENDPIFDVVGMGHGEGKPAARDHDEVLYGEEQ